MTYDEKELKKADANGTVKRIEGFQGLIPMLGTIGCQSIFAAPRRVPVASARFTAAIW